MEAVIALALNIAAFFYLRSWRPVVTLVKSYQLGRAIQRARIAGL